MNLLHFTTRAIRNLIERDPFEMQADSSLEVAEAISAALNDIYQLGPASQRQRTVRKELPDMATRTVTVTAGSASVGDNEFPAGDIGRTCKPVDGSWNSVDTRSTFLAAYDGPTTGPLAVDVYGDTVALEGEWLRTAGTPSLYHQGTFLRKLVPGSRESDWSYAKPAIGEPTTFESVPRGRVEGNEPPFLLRVYPLPDRAYTVELKVELRAPVYSIADLLDASVILPLPDGDCLSLLLPMVEARLATSALWARPEIAEVKMQAGERAMARISQIPDHPIHSTLTLGTPRGW